MSKTSIQTDGASSQGWAPVPTAPALPPIPQTLQYLQTTECKVEDRLNPLTPRGGERVPPQLERNEKVDIYMPYFFLYPIHLRTQIHPPEHAASKATQPPPPALSVLLKELV